MQKAPKPTEISSGQCQLSNAARAQVGELRAANEPSRAMVRLAPNAKLSSFPLNQRAMAQVTETMSDSAPIPKISRPAAMTQNSPVAAVTAAPTKQRTPNSSVPFFTPMRSMMIPPISTMMMFGRL